MNNQIKDFAVAAGAKLNEGFYGEIRGILMSPDKLEKFAELLIQECVRCAEGERIRNGDTEHNRAVSGVIESIKERFGVEQN